MMLSVMLVDDEKYYLDEISKILSEISDYEICGEYRNAFSAMESLENIVPDILITDLLMPGMSGIGLAKHVKHLYPNIKILLIVENHSLALEGFEAGVLGIILKPLIGIELLTTLRRVARAG